MWMTEQPPDVILSPTWSLADVCGSLDILPAAHHRAVAAVIRKLPPDWKRPLRRPSQPHFVQWRQTLANRTLALHLPGARQLLVKTGRPLWTQQRSSRVRYKRSKNVLSPALRDMFHTPMARYSQFVLKVPLNSS